MTFDKEKKGYNRVQVDEYLFALKNEYETKLSEQKNRIFQLKSELAEKEKSIALYEANKELIASALIKAMEKAEEIEKLTAVRYREEMASLRAFHEKWQAHYNRLLDKYPDDEGLRAIEKFNADISDILVGGAEAVKELERQFDEEEKRVAEQAPKEKKNAKKTSAPSAKAILAENAVSSNGFSFEEAWNPTDDLSTIMKDLGLGSDDEE